MSHKAGIDIAGKTGSAQTISNTLKAKMANKAAFKDNGWFVGFTPRRNPDIVVCVLFEGGEHGALAARLATQVIKVYVDKQNHKPIEHLAPPPEVEQKSAPTPAPPATQGRIRQDSIEVSGLWSDPGSDRLQGAHFRVKTGRQPAPRHAIAAPGMELFAQLPPPAPLPQKPEHIPQHMPWPQHTPWRGLPGVVATLPEPVWRAGDSH
jgi:penicillin-binding protein 2